ncbi:hypothetical protein BCR34DRAFT_63845 [Clohesyomyces aquaticus]|uniref:C2H2-type domain-containing protein n=1 Tax=Clohesyomyces aquaticus TaxID=1231657 RepID=A0A1Y1Z151_9PLEO|nr:hypothetical protein BCR34DRAFT_63845 [Clohesyomyces aquaticus]
MIAQACFAASAVQQTFDQAIANLQRNFWEAHQHLSEPQRLELWSRQLNRNVQSSPARNVPRTMPYGTCTTNQTPTPNPNPMDRTLSAPASVPMGRSASSLSYGSYTGATVLDQRSISNVSSWSSPADGHASQYSLTPEPTVRSRPSLQTINESLPYDVREYDPREYIESQTELSTSPSFSTQQDFSRLAVGQLTWSSSSDGSSSPSTVFTAPLMTSGLSSSSAMSYQNGFNNQCVNDFSHMGVDPSESSSMFPIFSQENFSFSSASDVDAKSITCDISLFPIGSSLDESVFPPAPISSTVSTISPSETQSCLAEDMRRSTSYSGESDSSSSSGASNRSRHLQRNREVMTQASRRIAPKATENNDQTRSPSSNVPMVRIRSSDGSSKDVAAISKAPYTRPKHEKVKCEQCGEKFRGTHELERHMQRKHAEVRKGWVCFDSSPGQKFLANCKHCRNKKIYGAYYNAAAHLRRYHFHPKQRGRKGKSDERRGGSGGGNDPPMEMLKNGWMREVDVLNDSSPSNKRSVPPRDADNTQNVSTDSFDFNQFEYPAYTQPPIDNTTTMPINFGFTDCDAFMNSNDAPYSATDDTSTQFPAFNVASFQSTPDIAADFEFDAYTLINNH